MLQIFKTIDNQMIKQTTLSEGCWVNIIAPTTQEINYLVNTMGIDESFVMSALDDEESSRVESEDQQTLVIVDVPIPDENSESSIKYTTIPMGIILTTKYLVTVSLQEHDFLKKIPLQSNKNMATNLRTRFLLMVLLKISKLYLSYLKDIEKLSSYTEKELHKTMRNKELIQLLGLEKSLVYFSTSLKGNEITLEKILRGRTIKLYEEDQHLLEDVIIETKQAVEMCSIYTSILSGTMDAFSSIISNNLNIAMKVLTSITLVMAIPTVITSFYGMNVVGGLPFDTHWWIPMVISGVLSLIVAGIFIKKGMFK